MSGARLFRQEHPFLTGCLLLALVMLIFWGGVTLLIASFGGPAKKELFSRRDGVGVIEIKGVITTADEIIADLTAFREEASIKAVLLRIDSPGGAVGASQELYEEVKRTNAIKPVVASLGSVAASGGLYAALGAGKIVANPGTITGSMGVIVKFANLEELFAKIGYRSEVIKSGALKDVGSAERPMTEEERLMLQELIDGVHSQFITAVAASRNLPEETVRGLADGRIFSGAQALDHQLVDALGNLNDAALLAAGLAGLDTAKAPNLIYPAKKDFSLLSLFMGEQARAALTRPLLMLPTLAYEWTMSP